MGAFGAIISKVILGLAQWGLEKIQRWVLEQRAAAMESRIKSLEARQKSYEDKEEIEEKIDAAKSKVRKEQALRDDIVKKRDALCEWANKKSL